MSIKARLTKLEEQHHTKAIAPHQLSPTLTPDQWSWAFSPDYQGAMPEFSGEVKEWVIKFGGKPECIKQLQLQSELAV